MKVIIIGKGDSRNEVERIVEEHPSALCWGLGCDVGADDCDVRFEVHLYGKHEDPMDRDVLTWVHPAKVKLGKNEFRLPVKECLELNGGFWNFNNSVCWMLSLALVQGAREIWLPGCDFAADRLEREHELPGVQYWIGFARARGVLVHTPRSSALSRIASYPGGIRSDNEGNLRYGY